MQDSLISRKALLEDMKNSITENSDTFDWINLINRQPAAYDVDKVVSELEKENERLKILKNNCIALCDHEVIGIKNRAYNYAIEIVKRGGKG